MNWSFMVNRKNARRQWLGGLWRRSRPVLVALALISGSFSRTSRARNGEPDPAGRFSPAGMLRSAEGAIPDSSPRLRLPQLRLPELYRDGTAIGRFSPLRGGGSLRAEEAALVG